MRRESGRGTSTTLLYKFYDPDGLVARAMATGMGVGYVLREFGDRFVEVVKTRGNVFLDEGINYLWRFATGHTGLTPFGSNSCIGVGDGVGDPHPSQTGLLGTNKYYKRVDLGYPTLSGTSVVFQSTFGPDEANFDWNEWTVANGCGDEHINLNRKVESLGTKSSGFTWILQIRLTIV